jgi:methionyl-tRNA formyltransferase
VRILFWGTPAFAVPSLRALLGEGHDVVGVVTRPDRPTGRGRVLTPPPVKDVAEEEGIPVLQPEQPRGDEFMRVVRALDPELSVVVAYGQILKPEVLALPAQGSINVHASLLPELRGAAPIQWAIMRGFAESGVTIMRMVEALDAGPMLYQVREPIGPDETASELSLRLSEIGAEALVEALALLEGDAIEETEQDHALATYAPRLTNEDARIDWTQDAVTLAARIRGLDEVPGAWTTLHGQRVNLNRPTLAESTAGETEPGLIRDFDAGP